MMTNINLALALNYIDQKKFDLAKEMIELEMESQSTYFPVTSFSKGDLDPEVYDTSSLTEFDIADIAGRMANAYLETGYWIDLKTIMEDCYPECIKEQTE